MTLTAQIATNRIIRELCESETELDLTLARSASLLATLAKARVDTGSSFAEGQVAMMRLVRSLTALTEARADLARTHGELRKLGEVRADIVFPSESKGSLAALEEDSAAQAA
ncbi:MAG: hypothetical protein U9R07_09285 [Pseudomonadota bacterium]|nr:hypothetical protein [Pseudomonadota bacterium]